MQPIIRLAAHLIRLSAKAIDTVTNRLQQTAMLLNNLLPALLHPPDLMNLIKKHYDQVYANTAPEHTSTVYEWGFENWEKEVIERHGITRGRILVLGAGIGREAFALARLGLTIVALEGNGQALQCATRTARAVQIPVGFVQGSFFHLPFVPSQFPYVLMSGIMYSSIPGSAQRQAWLAELSRYVAPNGLIVLNFLIDYNTPSRVERLAHAINRVLVNLPGSSRTYQPGDRYTLGHFLHAFQSESEIREELAGTDATIHDLDWRKGFAVVGFPPHRAAARRSS